MKKGLLRWLLPLFRYGLCVVAICYLVMLVSWHDRVRLNDTGKTWFRVLEQREHELVILRDGQPTTVSREQIHVAKVDGQDVP